MRRISMSKQGLGWFLATMLFLSSQAWGLDFDRRMTRTNTDSAQILSTLGRDRTVAKAQPANPMQIKLIKKKSKSPRTLKSVKHRT